MSSPVFSEKSFAEWSQGFSGETMTLKGAINKCILLFATLLVPAAWIWMSTSQAEDNAFFNPFIFNNLKVFLYGSVIIGFILALVITFKKDWAPFMAPIYAVAQGIFLGLISSFFNAIFPGIVLQAVTITLLIFAVMLVAYRAGWLRATPMFTKVLMFATLGIGVFYLITWIMSMFGVQSFYMGNSWLSIGVSALIAGVAAFNLIIDFTLIDEQSKAGAPKYMEWYAAFGLMVTMVWLYLEILRLLSKLQSRD
jgi:uncharacterized YccA/Bax inhibitor family protein